MNRSTTQNPARPITPWQRAVMAIGAAVLGAALTPGSASAAPNVKPVINAMSVSPTGLYEGQTFTIDVNATDPDGTIVLYEFNFSDVPGWVVGTNSTTHAFAIGGSYTVSVRITDDRNGKTTGIVDVVVFSEPPPAPPPPPAPTPSPLVTSGYDAGRVTINVSRLTGKITISS